MAEREGPILPLIRAVIAPASYCLERCVCIDTTAAGGNASLLSAAEEAPPPLRPLPGTR